MPNQKLTNKNYFVIYYFIVVGCFLNVGITVNNRSLAHLPMYH